MALPSQERTSLFERFTERARQVVVLAQDEARALKHNYIGTEHILLGLLREEEGLAARVLESRFCCRPPAIFVERADPYGPKSLGELPTVPVPAAIGNALYSLGLEVHQLPITAERVLAALDARRLGA